MDKRNKNFLEEIQLKGDMFRPGVIAFYKNYNNEYEEIKIKGKAKEIDGEWFVGVCKRKAKIEVDRIYLNNPHQKFMNLEDKKERIKK